MAANLSGPIYYTKSKHLIIDDTDQVSELISIERML